MRRHISPHNPVRRRLFVDDDDDISTQARTDNFSNAIQEDMKRETVEKSLKWNFDFGTETPLEGDYEWSKRDGDTWIAMKPADEATMMQNANETTPRRQSDETLRISRKRKREEKRNDTETVAARRITF